MERRHVRYWGVGEGRQVVGPKGVAASADHVAVSEWKKDEVSRISLFDRTSGDLVRRIGSLGSGNGQLNAPSGLRFSRDGTLIMVADDINRRVSQFNTGDGTFDKHIVVFTVDQGQPTDVEEVDGGWIVPCWNKNTLYKAPVGGGAPIVVAGPGAGPGQLEYPTAVAVLPGGSYLVRERDNGGRFQVLAPK